MLLKLKHPCGVEVWCSREADSNVQSSSVVGGLLIKHSTSWQGAIAGLGCFGVKTIYKYTKS